MPNPVVNPTLIPATVPIPFPSARDPAPEVLQLKVPVPKTGLKNALPRDNLNTMGTARVQCALEHTQDTLTGGNGITIARVSCTGAHSR